MNFFDAVWPMTGRRTFVDCSAVDMEEIGKAVVSPIPRQWLLLVSDFDAFGQAMPDAWRRMPPDGVPSNVAIGADIATMEQAEERIGRLRKLRTVAMLFVYLRRGHTVTPEGLSELLQYNWRCGHCGRRGEGPIPDVCPTGMLCLGEERKIRPQVHWIVDLGRTDGAPSVETINEGAGRAAIPYWGLDNKQLPAWLEEAA